VALRPEMHDASGIHAECAEPTAGPAGLLGPAGGTDQQQCAGRRSQHLNRQRPPLSVSRRAFRRFPCWPRPKYGTAVTQCASAAGAAAVPAR